MTAYNISEQAKRRNELLQDLIDYISIEFEKIGLKEQEAKEKAEDVAFKIHEKWKGIIVVFPMRPKILLEKLKKQVLSDFTGNNFVDVVRKYSITERTIYKWVLEEQKRKTDKNQGKLDF